ncbi:MAG TPA: pilus assembly protein TadG [Alphaproteobacteria bacterium]|nr:pilus assembly protein TadG [Alphaproteobacteria bacterium]HAJ47010.1 pilus assembly protein TadG [Alphaproteobacteria bacterium]
MAFVRKLKMLTRKAAGALAGFALCTSANMTMMYGIALVPTLGAAGAAIDMGRAVAVRQRLIEALDAAALAVGSTPGLTTAQMIQKAQEFFNANFPPDALGTPGTISVTPLQDGSAVMAIDARLDTTFIGIFGIEELQVRAEIAMVPENRALEMVLSLDNTGSMGSNGKLESLKSASKSLVNILFGDNPAPEKTRMGLVPFSESVRLTTATAINNGWMDMNGQAPWARLHFDNNKHPFAVWQTMRSSTWGGCVEARADGHDELDTAPSVTSPATLFVPFFQPDEPDSSAYPNYSQNYMSDGVAGDEMARLRNSAKYVNRRSTRPNQDCNIQAVMPLTNNKAQILSYLDGMKAQGYTHIAEGAAWGWRLLSPTAPFTEAVPYDNQEWIKAFVLLSDGENTIPTRTTALLSDYTAYGYLSEGRLGTTNAAEAARRQDDKTQRICTRMKDLGIRVYTILLEEAGTATVNMMRNCASSPEAFFPTPTGAELEAAFQQIAADLTNLRLAK